jgi:hypothetical protein
MNELRRGTLKFNKLICTAAVVSAALLINTSAFAKDHKNDRETGRGTGPTVYVTSQGLYYDSIVVVESLPMKGNFQQLIPLENGLETEFGPGTPGHLGGRWWIDVTGDGIMNKGDKFFLCPLLGPGRLDL